MEKIKKCTSYIKNRTVIANIILCLVLISILILSFNYNFREIVMSHEHLSILRQNVLYFINVITKSIPIVIILLLIYIWRKFATKWVIKVEKLDIGGASIVFERPEELFKQQIKNFMNTKRTLFYFDPERDNISDTISSYYETYRFIREKMQVYDTKSSQQSKYYETANNMLHCLNEFLTSHQSNYKRWFDHKTEEFCTEDFCRDISEIQKEYRRYDAIVEGFRDLNTDFLIYAEIFDVNTDKWAVAQK